MRSNQPLARSLSHSPEILTHPTSIVTQNDMFAGGQRFGNKCRTRSQWNKHITAERTGNITGACRRAGSAARACMCVRGVFRGAYAHYVFAAPESRRE
ncbi:unnamed protein product [Colias eurytheme]|nr:unnamed protein product [Colias eurytheme]